MDTTEARLIEIICTSLGISEGSVKKEAKIQDDLGADSLDCIEIIMAIEDEFDIEIADEDVNFNMTIQQAVEFVDKKVN